MGYFSIPSHPTSPVDAHLLGVVVQLERLVPFPGLVASRHRVTDGLCVGLRYRR